MDQGARVVAAGDRRGHPGGRARVLRDGERGVRSARTCAVDAVDVVRLGGVDSARVEGVGAAGRPAGAERRVHVGRDAGLGVAGGRGDGEAAGCVALEVDRAGAVRPGVREPRERERGGERPVGVDLGGGARAGGALVADPVGDLVAVDVALAAYDRGVVARPVQRDGAPGAGETGAAAAGQVGLVTLDDAAGRGETGLAGAVGSVGERDVDRGAGVVAARDRRRHPGRGTRVLGDREGGVRPGGPGAVDGVDVVGLGRVG